jgi:N-acetylglutamate synthase-like GNAT family acetyltransferase
MDLRTELRPGDIGEIVRLHGMLYAQEYGWDHTFEAYVAESLARFALNYDPQRERFWVAEKDGRISGSIGIVDAGGGAAQLRWFLVVPSARGHGLGQRLIVEALAFTRQAQYRTIYLWTVRGLDAAAYLYKTQGFTLTEEHDSTQWGTTVREQRYDLPLG